MRIGLAGYHPNIPLLLGEVRKTSGVQFQGFFSDNTIESTAVAALENVRVFSSLNDLLREVDAVIYCQTEPDGLRVAEKIIKYGRHLYIHNLSHFQPDYLQYLSNLAVEAEVFCLLNFDLLYHPVVSNLICQSINPQIVEISLGRLSDSTDNDSSERYLAAGSLLVKSLTKRSTKPRVQLQSLVRNGAHQAPLLLRMEYADNCTVNLMMHGDAVPGHNRIRIYEHHRLIEADMDFGLISIQQYTDEERTSADSEMLINIEQLPDSAAALRHFIQLISKQRVADYVSFSDLYQVLKWTESLRDRTSRMRITMQ